MSTGLTEFTLQHPDDLIEVGDFRICVIAQSDNLQNCGDGYNSEDKKPESHSLSAGRNMHNREMTISPIPVFLVVVLVISISVNEYHYSAYAGGPRLDWDERYEDIPGAPECWVDGYDDGLENPFDHDRNEDCKDKGNQY